MCVFVTLMSLSGHTRHLPPITAFNTLGLPLYRLSCRKLPGTTFEFSIVSSSSGDSPALRTRPFPPPVGQAGYFNKVVAQMRSTCPQLHRSEYTWDTPRRTSVSVFR